MSASAASGMGYSSGRAWVLATAASLLLSSGGYAQDAGLSIRRSRMTGLATFVNGRAAAVIPVRAPAGPAAQATPADFLTQYGNLFGVTDPGKQLVQSAQHMDSIGHTHTSYHQFHRGVRVFAGVLRVHQDAAGSFRAANGHFFPVPEKLVVQPRLTARAAEKLAQQALGQGVVGVEKSELVIVDPGWYGDPPIGAHLAYHIILSDGWGIREAFFIDAASGAVLDRWNMLHNARNRQVYNGNGGSSLPGTLIRSEGQAPVALVDANRAYDYAGDTYDYFFRAFGRDGLDGVGGALLITVNSTAPPCPNAFWDGTRMVFCSGTVTDDVMAHELAHGVTEHTADLIYQNQSGQLNESYSDIAGEMVDLFNGNAAFPGTPGGSPSWPSHPTGSGVDTPNNLRTAACSSSPSYNDGMRWLMGEDATAFGGAIRDMWNPPCMGDPDRANSPLQTCNPLDGGGVHSGSGIPNHAFAIVTDGKTFNGQSVSGIGPIKSAAVWYRALSTYLTPTSDFSDAYDALNQAAADLIGTFPPDPRNGLPSSSQFTAADAQQIDKALLATEMHTNGACGGNPEPGLAVLTPNGGESLGRGVQNRIRWSSIGGGANVTIDLMKGGAVHSNIVSGAANNGSYTWNMPAGLALASDYRVRVNDGVRTDTSDADFSIIVYNSTCPEAICLAPGVTFSGQTLGATSGDISSCGSSDTKAVWHAYSPTVSGNVSISTVGSGFDTTLALYTACGGSEIACNDNAQGSSAIINANLNAGSTYLIRVAGASGASGEYQLAVTGGQGGSCGAAQPNLTVFSPNGGEVWPRGGSRTITWFSSLGGATVNLELLQGGSPVLTIAGAAPNTGSFSWNIPPAQAIGSNYRVRVSDGVSIDPSNADFSIIEPGNYFTEQFTGGADSFDLTNRSILFTPGGSSGYTACLTSISSLPTDPAGGTPLSMGDDSAASVTLSGGATVKHYGASFGSFFVGSNGYVTFGSGDQNYDESINAHFALRRIAALFDDLNPSAGGTVSWRQLADRAVITWQNVPEFNTSNSNTFQIEMYFDGRTRIAWLGIASIDSIVGLSNAGGTPSDFSENNLSSLMACATTLDYYTELFNGGGSDNFDISNNSLLLTPGGSSGYFACTGPISSLPTDPSGGTALALTDDSSAPVTLGSGAIVQLYGASYGSFHVGSNGYITFETGDSQLTESLSAHFALKRIAALFDDLNPAAGGTVSWRQLADRVAVTWLNVPEFGTTNSNTFQIELFFDGRIRIAWLAVAVVDALAGVSNGGGTPAGFTESNLSNYSECGVGGCQLTQNFESGLGTFVIDNAFGAGNGLWHISTACDTALPNHSATHALYYGSDALCTYDTGNSEGVATSGPVNLAGVSPPVSLTFKYRLQTEGASSTYDAATVEVSQNGGPFVAVAGNLSGGGSTVLNDPGNGWESAIVDLSAYANSSIQIRLHFRTADAAFNALPGFYVDDIELCTDTGCTPPAPPVACEADPSAICAGQSTILTATPGSGGDTVEWFTGSCGGTPVPGGATPLVSPTATTTYYVRTRNTSSDCSSLTCCETTVWVDAAPPSPGDPGPATGATGVALLTDLAWSTGAGACGSSGAPVTIQFSEVPPGTLVNGALIGNVQFGFSSADATIGASTGPGETAFNHPPNMEGDGTGTLTLNFSSRVFSVGYGFAHSTGVPQASSTTMTLYDIALNPLGSVSADAANHGFGFVEGSNSASRPQGIARAVITFAHPGAARFVLDDLTYTPCAGTISAASPSIIDATPAPAETLPPASWRVPRGESAAAGAPAVSETAVRAHLLAQKSNESAAPVTFTLGRRETPAVSGKPAAPYGAAAPSEPAADAPAQRSAGAGIAPGVCLVINGDFETGDLSGWTDQSSSGGFVLNDGTFDPASGDGPLPPCAGSFGVISDQPGPGIRTIYQDIAIPAAGAVSLRWTDMIRNHAGIFQDPDQEFRVEIRDPATNTPIATVFSTNPGDPLTTGCNMRVADLSAFGGQTIRLAFTEQDSLGFFNVHLDDICIEAGVCPTTYDVYLGTTNPPTTLVCDDTSELSCDPGILAPATQYFWKVVATNCCGQTQGAVWSFTTGGLPAIAQWRSDRLHAATVQLPINLDPGASGNDLTGPGVESRPGGIQRIRLSFDQPVTLASPGSVTVIGRTTVNGSLGSPVPYIPTSVSMSGNQTLLVTFAPGLLPDESCYTISLAPNVTAPPLTGDLDVNVRSLHGDATGSGSLTLSDVLLIKTNVGDTASAYPRLDLDYSGLIDPADVAEAKTRVASPAHRALCP